MLKKLEYYCALVLVSCAASSPVFALQAEDSEQRLASVYQGKNFSLPGPYCGASLQFDVEGKLIQGGLPGAWTLCQNIQVKELHRNGDAINIAAQRIYLWYDMKDRKFQNVEGHVDKHSKSYKEMLTPLAIPRRQFAGQQVSLQIPVPATQDSAAVQSAIDKVLKPFDSVPPQPDSELWQSFLANPQKTDSQKTDKEAVGIPFNNGEVLRVGNGVTAPQIVNNPNPSYTDEAREAKFTGTGIYSAIIDRQGNVARVSVVRPLGLGLDENAAQTVRTWQFKPALKDGKPVAVAVNIEVKFNLF